MRGPFLLFPLTRKNNSALRHRPRLRAILPGRDQRADACRCGICRTVEGHDRGKRAAVRLFHHHSAPDRSPRIGLLLLPRGGRAGPTEEVVRMVLLRTVVFFSAQVVVYMKAYT